MGVAPSAIRFQDFAASQGFSLVGDAAISGKILRLTPAKNARRGAVRLREKQPVGSGFETTFQFQLTEQGGLAGGADGFAFVIQNSGPEALGGLGSAGGFAFPDPMYRSRSNTAIPWSVAIFFDTFQNKNEKDPSDNYIAFCTYGGPRKQNWPAPRLAFTRNLPFQLKDKKVHTARIRFQPPVLSVLLDESAAPVLAAAVDLSTVVDPRGSAWVGFTASTGWGHQNHDILNWSFEHEEVSSNISVVSSQITFVGSTCLAGRSLCTSERAIVEANGKGYHVVLPANLEWGVKIPNPSGQPLVVGNAHGIVCWDVKAQGSDGCSGPSGKGANAGVGFLAADAPEGSLIRKTREGVTWFSVNARSGAGFKDSEGFFEFDLEIK